MKDYNRYVPGPCPQCGTPESAAMGSTSWGHDYYCCSEACGLAYAKSEAKLQRDLEGLCFKEQILSAQIASVRREIALAKAGTPAAPVTAANLDSIIEMRAAAIQKVLKR